jgi:glycosyltransferase involved in cell wall biosynthesis
MEKVSICIPAYNASKTIRETLDSCVMQNYPNLEIIVSDNCSTDDTYKIVAHFIYSHHPSANIKLYKTEKNNGGGPNMDNCVRLATGSIIVFLCSDDIFTDPNVISDIAMIFNECPNVGYVGHWYYQFLDPDPAPVRIHHSLDPYFQADNQSGIAFRKCAIKGNFAPAYWIEGASMVKRVLDDGWSYKIIQYDTVGVRIHPGGNTSTKPEPYVVSPTLTWLKLVGRRKFFLTIFISLIQYKNWGKYRFMLREAWYFIKLRPINLFRPDFWFWFLIALLVPKCILRPLTQKYKKYCLKNLIRITTRDDCYPNIVSR